MNLLFVALSDTCPGEKIGQEDDDVPAVSTDEDIIIQAPAILKPVALWSGKQARCRACVSDSLSSTIRSLRRFLLSC